MQAKEIQAVYRAYQTVYVNNLPACILTPLFTGTIAKTTRSRSLEKISSKVYGSAMSTKMAEAFANNLMS